MLRIAVATKEPKTRQASEKTMKRVSLTLREFRRSKHPSLVSPIAFGRRMARWMIPALVLMIASCGAHAPSIRADRLPAFDDVYACSADVYPSTPLPDDLVLDRDCVAIDAEHFRKLVLLAEPTDARMWKSGFLVIARSLRHGDRYFYLSFPPAAFTRPGASGAYVLPESKQVEWEAVTYAPLAEWERKKMIVQGAPMRARRP